MRDLLDRTGMGVLTKYLDKPVNTYVEIDTESVTYLDENYAS
jgi:hypothetical protein